MTGTTFPTNYLVRFRDGVDPDAAADRLRRDFFDSTAYPTFPPTIVRTVERVAYLPGVLAAVVVLLALGTLLHGLVVVLRRRRRDLAVMQAVGFSGRQVLGSVGVQATTIAPRRAGRRHPPRAGHRPHRLAADGDGAGRRRTARAPLARARRHRPADAARR